MTAAPSAAVAGTVGLRLTSPRDGTVVAPFDTVTWQVTGFVSPNDNLGLALIGFDFVQDPGNPARFDIPRAQPLTLPMRSFDRPDGFTNPGVNWKLSGFGGAPVGEKGAKNRLQIGGMQNTFGVPGPVLGPNGEIRYGQKTHVDAGVGQLPQGEIIAYGDFRAPAVPGTYVFRIQNGIANVLTQINVPPQASKPAPAAIQLLSGSFTFTVQ